MHAKSRKQSQTRNTTIEPATTRSLLQAFPSIASSSCFLWTTTTSFVCSCSAPSRSTAIFPSASSPSAASRAVAAMRCARPEPQSQDQTMTKSGQDTRRDHDRNTQDHDQSWSVKHIIPKMVELKLQVGISRRWQIQVAIQVETAGHNLDHDQHGP